MVDEFQRLRKQRRLSREAAARLVGCSPRTLAAIERGEGKNKPREATIAAMDSLVRQWRGEVPRDDNSYAPGVVRIDTITDPLEVLRGGLFNSYLMLGDEEIPLRDRLIHTRSQLQFLLKNFLQDSSLPPAQEGES